ncbi:MAG: hypothetical protein HUU21_20605 [Polyangiaceae bacterium]|nr:hypothetical protein [Polyangiaceae bacterium]
MAIFSVQKAHFLAGRRGLGLGSDRKGYTPGELFQRRADRRERTLREAPVW